MASAMKSTIDIAVSKLMAMGQFGDVLDHEPKNAPASGYTAAAWMVGASPAPTASGLGTVTMVYVLNIRLYRNMLEEPADDKGLLERADQIYDDFLGDFDLGSTVRNVDVFGEQGDAMTATTGYVEVGGTMYRIIDIVLPVVVNNTIALAK